jgi:glutamate decarboxylase
MGSKGYALMIDHGIETARHFSKIIQQRRLFQLITTPQLNILTYRVVPVDMQKKLKTTDRKERQRLDAILDDINIKIQRLQREAGKSFVSRTRLKHSPTDDYNIVVLRSVIMNPMTSVEILEDILDEQESIFHDLMTS